MAYRIIDDYNELLLHNGKLSEKMFQAQLYQSICVPSTIHAYSCGVEYMRDWFLSHFRDNYFKYIYVNGKNLYLDFKQFNKEQMLVREKPMLAVIPTLDTDFDNDTGSLYELPTNIWRRNRNFQRSFYQDKKNNIFVAMEAELMVMNFDFRIRLESRSQQLDLWNYMKLEFRVGATESHHIAIDFHIPSSIIFAIAELAHFELVKDLDNNPVRLREPYKFLRYLNSNSGIPITYKLRSLNGKNEFFMRYPDIPIHIALQDKIDVDTGEQAAMISKNYELSMSARLRMPCPQYYALYSTSEIYRDLNLSEGSDVTIGLYNIKITEVPELNKRGWDQMINTEYCEDDFPTEYPYKIDISPLFPRDGVGKVIEDSLSMCISPEVFLETHVFNSGYEIPVKVEYNSLDDIFIVIDKPIQSLRTYIVIYIDLKYVNTRLTELDRLNETRHD